MTSIDSSDLPVRTDQVGPRKGGRQKTLDGEKQKDFMSIMISTRDRDGTEGALSVKKDRAAPKGSGKKDPSPDLITKDRPSPARTDKKADPKAETDEKASSASDFEKDMREAIKKDLGVTDEEIDEVMKELGLSFMDLLDPKKLISLMQGLTGTDTTVGLLMNKGAGELLKDQKALSEAFMQEGSKERQLNTDPIAGDALTGKAENTEDTAVIGPTESLDLTGGTKAVKDPAQMGQEAINEQAVLSSKDDPSVEAGDGSPVLMTGPEASKAKGAEETAPAGPEPQVEEEDGVDPLSPAPSTEEGKEEGESDKKDSSSFGRDEAPIFGKKEERSPIHSAEPGLTAPVPEEKEAPAVVRPFTLQETREIISQIATQVRLQNTGSLHSLEMTLNPERLGKLLLKVSEEDGTVRARIQTENETVKNALEIRMTELRENLEAAGMKVNEVEISVSTQAFSDREEAQADFGEALSGDRNENAKEGDGKPERDNRRQNIDLDHLEDIQGLMTEEERLTAQIMKDEGNRVNFSA